MKIKRKALTTEQYELFYKGIDEAIMKDLVDYQIKIAVKNLIKELNKEIVNDKNFNKVNL